MTTKINPDSFEFIWEGFNFIVVPKSDFSSNLKANIWDMTQSISFDYYVGVWGGKEKKHRVVTVKPDPEGDCLEVRFKKRIEPLVRKKNAYTLAAHGWAEFEKEFENAQHSFIRNYLLHQYPFLMQFEQKSVSHTSSEIHITKVINFIDKRCTNYTSIVPISLEMKLVYLLDGKRNWSTFGYLPDISKTSLLECAICSNGLRMCHGQMTIDNATDTKERLGGYSSVLGTACKEIQEYLPAFSYEDVATIFKNFRETFWEEVKVVNKFKYHISSYERSEDSIGIRIEFGCDSRIDAVISSSIYTPVTFTMHNWVIPKNINVSYKWAEDNPDYYINDVVTPTRVRKVVIEMLNTLQYPEKNLATFADEITTEFLKVFEKDMPKGLRENGPSNPIPEFEKIKSTYMAHKICGWDTTAEKNIEEAKYCIEHLSLDNIMNVYVWLNHLPDATLEGFKSALIEHIEKILRKTVKGKKDENYWAASYVKSLETDKSIYELYMANRSIKSADNVLMDSIDKINHFCVEELEAVYKWLKSRVDDDPYGYIQTLIDYMDKPGAEKVNDSSPLTDDWIRQKFDLLFEKIQAIEDRLDSLQNQ